MCAASPALAAACDIGLKKSKTGVIEHDYELSADETVTVLDEIASEGGSGRHILMTSGANARLTAHARMYAIDEYYQLPTLEGLASENFHHMAKTDFDTEGFIYDVKEVHDITPKEDKGLRAILQKTVQRNMERLVQDRTFMAHIAEHADLQDFAAGMRKLLARQLA